MAGQSFSGIGGDRSEVLAGTSDYWIISVDSLGNKLFDKRYGGNGHNFFSSFCQSSDNGFLFVGYSDAGISFDKTQSNWDSTNTTYDFWIVKTDSSLNKIWDKDFGGNKGDIPSKIIPVGNNNYLLAGSSESGISGDKSDTCRGNYDYWVVLIDSAGNKIWDKTYGGNDWDMLYGVVQTNNGYLLAGGSSSDSSGGDKSYPNHDYVSDYWVVAIDSLGNKLWDRVYGGFWADEYVNNIAKTSDGNFLLSGHSRSDIGGDKSEDNQGGEQTWLIKIDAHGNKLWDKTITSSGFDWGGRAYTFNNNEIWVCSGSYSSGGIMKSVPSHNLKKDFWLVKLKDTTTVSIQPVANFIASDTVFCVSNCLSYFDQSINNSTSWFWQFPGATPNFSTSPNPTNICYNAGGVYDALLVVCNTTSCDSFLIPNYIHANPQATVIITQSFDTLFCISNDATNFQWYNSGGIIPGAIDSFYVTGFAVDTFYIVVSNSFGCDSTSSFYVINSYGLPSTVIASSDSSLCGYGSINFYDNSTNNPFSWQWYFNGATPSTSSLENPTGILYNSGSGSYDVTLVACNSYGCDSITFPDFVNVYSLPIVNITLSNDTLTCTTPAISYQWYDNGFLINGATNSFYVVLVYGNYYVKIIDVNGCQGFSNSIITSLNNYYFKNSIVEISPNPTSGKITISTNNLHNQVDFILVSDNLGKIVLNFPFKKQKQEIDLSHLSKGLYTIKVVQEGKVSVSKVVVE